jgi:membrane protein YqaA with SNARE-associated domain
MKLLLTTFVVAVASALFPLINIEAYLATVGSLVDSYGVWPVSIVAALGQAVGKVLWYEVGRSSMSWSFVRKKMETDKWRAQYEKVKRWSDARPWADVALLFLSATAGIPPLAIMAVLAGQLEVNRLLFFATVLVGRVLRFAGLLGGIGWLAHSGLFT